jgi:hypothetical protein
MAVPRSAQPVALRRPWLHAAALAWGCVVVVGHVMTYGDVMPAWLHRLEPIDVVKHFTGIGVFTLLYRASWAGVEGGAAGLSPNLASLLVCCGFGALCEGLQLFVPLRDFNYLELALNTASPAALIGLWALVELLWE